jgi:hypothetical protein
MEKKIRIVTFHTAINYGAVLQAYALQKKLRENYTDVKLIDYNTNELKKKYPLICFQKSIKGFILAVIDCFRVFKTIKKHKKFNDFISDQILFTNEYISYRDLKKFDFESGVFITGSDQVFNPDRIEEERQVFYLDFVKSKDTIKKISYAASFGTKAIEKEKFETISNFLEDFDTLLIREQSGVDLVDELSTKTAYKVIDPVFLMDKCEWRKIMKEYKNIPNKYLLYYRLLDTKNSDEMVEKIASKLGLEIVVITNLPLNRITTRYNLRDIGPAEFLHLFDHADFVATSSFHGTAFSIIFNKQFIFCDEFKNKSDRAKDIMNTLKIKNRLTENDVDHLIKNKIDYSRVNERLDQEISNSMRLLVEAIES